MKSHSMLSLPYKDQGLPVYRTCEVGEPHPAVILIHEVWGLTDHIKSVANRLCQEGYEVVAPDLIAGTELEHLVSPELQKALFDPEERAKRQVEIRAMMAPLASADFAAGVLAKLKACFSYLKEEPAVTKIAVMGFCFGGTYSFGLAAHQPGLAAAIPFYGHGEHYLEAFADISCPILAFYGQDDDNVTGHLPAIQEEMKTLDKDFSYKVYAGAGHAFFNDTNQVTYRKQAADDAWDRSLAFLAKHTH